MPRTISLSLLALACAAAEDPAPVIIVTAERGASELERVPFPVAVIEAEDIRERGGATSLHEWLRGVAGVSVLNRYGGLDGGTPDVRIRGVDPAFTQVLLDGIPLNDPTTIGGGFVPSLINPPGVRRMEVLKGAQGGLYGSRAIGGVIDMQGLRPTASPERTVSATGGSFGTLGGEMSATGPLGAAAGYAVAVSGLASAGFSTLTDQQPGTEGSPGRYEDDALRRAGATARVELRPDADSQVHLSAYAQRTHQDYDETGPDDALPTLIGRTLRLAGGGEAERGMFTASGDLAWTGIERINSTNYGPPPAFLPGEVAYRGDELYAQGRLAARPDEHLRLAVGGDWRQERGRQGYAGLPDDWSESATIWGGYLQAGWDGPYLGISLAGRHDQHDDFGGADTYRAALALWPVPGVLKLRGSVATAFRAPSLYQLRGFADFGFGTFRGNPGLDPETAIAYETGIDWYPSPSSTLTAAAFRTSYRTKIAYDGAATPNTYVNLDSGAQVEGVEGQVHLGGLAGSRLDLDGHLTLLDSDDGGGRRLAYVAGATGGGRATLRQHLGRYGLWQSLAAERSSGFATGLAGAGGVSGFTLVEAAAGATIGRTWEASVRVENLLGERYLLTSSFGSDFSTAPRAVYGTVTARF